jgi:hypothetical protein
VTNAKLANMAQASVKGRRIGVGTGVPQDLSGTDLSDIINSAYFQRPPFAVAAFAGSAKTLSPGPMGDAGYWIDYTGTGQTITVGPDSGGVHPWGSVYFGSCQNAATIVAGAGVTIRSAAGLAIPAGASWVLVNVGVNTWYLSTDAAGGQRTIKTYSGTAVTAVIGDAQAYVRLTGTNPTYTVPPNSSVAFPVGTQIDGIGAASACTIVAGAGVTIVKARTLVTLGAGSGWTLIKAATDAWDAHGDFV